MTDTRTERPAPKYSRGDRVWVGTSKNTGTVQSADWDGSTYFYRTTFDIGGETWTHDERYVHPASVAPSKPQGAVELALVALKPFADLADRLSEIRAGELSPTVPLWVQSELSHGHLPLWVRDLLAAQAAHAALSEARGAEGAGEIDLATRFPALSTLLSRVYGALADEHVPLWEELADAVYEALAALPAIGSEYVAPEELRRLSEEATPGEWRADHDTPLPQIFGEDDMDAGDDGRSIYYSPPCVATLSDIAEADANADFVVASVNFVRALLAASPVPLLAGGDR